MCKRPDHNQEDELISSNLLSLNMGIAGADVFPQEVGGAEGAESSDSSAAAGPGGDTGGNAIPELPTGSHLLLGFLLSGLIIWLRKTFSS